MIDCKSCGAELSEGSAFCTECGKPLNDSDPSGAVDQITPMTGLITPDPENQTSMVSKFTPTLTSGQVFADRYTIENVIGRGGMGVVYRAIDKVSGKTVALKLINASHLGGERAIKRLIEEGVTARDIRHPNVVAVYDVGLSGEQPFVAMEYLDGLSLRSWHGRVMQRGEFVALRIAARIVVEILDGLSAAHNAGVIHRDLKPENIILLADPSEKAAPLKLLDFGIARAAGATSGVSSSTGLGTPEYMAPEQRTNPDSVGPSADLYSISVMLYELLVNVVPGRHWQPPSGGRSDVPLEVDTLILKGLSDNRTLRPQTAMDYRQALIGAVNRIPIRGGKGNADTPKATTKPLVWIAAGSAVVATFVIAGVAIASMDTGANKDPWQENDGPGPDDWEGQDEAGIPIPPPTPPTPPASPFAYYSGTWADGIGGYYDLQFNRNGAFTGSGRAADGTPLNIRGGISGRNLQYVLNVRGTDVASGRGAQTDQCHFNYQTLDGYGNVNLSGAFHVNHEPGEPCP